MTFLSFTNNSFTLNDTEEANLLSFYFVSSTSKKGGLSEIMEMALKACKEKFDGALAMISEEECKNLKENDLKNSSTKFIFVFDKFDVNQEAFTNLLRMEGVVFILGCRALLTILLEGIPSPPGLLQVHNFAMHELSITVTKLKTEQKNKIRQLVKYMGGIFYEDLKETVTHLVAGGVGSEKYEVACGNASKNNLKVMHPDWIDEVWKISQNSINIVKADDSKFDKFKLPIFFNLVITSTGMSVKERENLKALVESNGGKYSPAFNAQVDILIMEKESIGSTKYKAAVKLKKLCLSANWIHKSIEKGYSIPYKDYELREIGEIKASTPTKSNVNTSKFNNDNTMLSDISRMSNQKADFSINETQLTKRASVVGSQSKKTLENASLRNVSKVGRILDGFSFYLSGMTSNEITSMTKTLLNLGAKILDKLCGQITHVLVGESEPKLFKELDERNIEPKILKKEWINKVIKEGKIMFEEEFEVTRLKDNPQTAKSFNGVFKKPETPRQQQLQEQPIENQNLEPFEDDSSSFIIPFLTGKNVYIYGFDDEILGGETVNMCERLGANLVNENFPKEIDYVITSAILNEEIKPGVKFKHIVTDIWIDECVEAGKCIDAPFFYHQPLLKLKPLQQILSGEYFVVTNYKGKERIFIKMMVENMGGIYNEALKRIENPIVISNSTDGKKFESAKTWGLSVLKVEWLVQCMERKARVDETPFLIGGTLPSSRNMKEHVIQSSEEIAPFDAFDPPIENLPEDPPNFFESTPIREKNKSQGTSTPKAPMSPQLDISNLVADMPTPQRKLTKEVLLANQKKAMASSPRREMFEKLLETPQTKQKGKNEAQSSPYPELPVCMTKSSEGYGIRPENSPASQYFHKRKQNGLDSNYIPRNQQKRSRPNEAVPENNLKVDKYEFYRANLSSYDSPDPRTAETQNLIDINRKAKQTVKCLDYEEEENDKEDEAEHDSGSSKSFKEFEDLDKAQQTKPNKKPACKTTNLTEDFGNSKIHLLTESENLVEWKDVSEFEGEAVKSRRVFAFSAFQNANEKDKEEMSKLAEIIENLGGEIDNDEFTHLIAMKPNRGEKYLRAITRGIFILHPDYLKKCQEEFQFVDESEFEYGNPKYKSSLNGSKDNLFNASYKWRKWIKEEYQEKYKDGAFTGKKFLFVGTQEKIKRFASIITEGGGKVVEMNCKSPFKPAFMKRQNIDYCLMESTNLLTKENMNILKTCKILCKGFSFINDYLMRDRAEDE